MLTCVIDDEGQESLVDEIARVIAPGGVVYASDILVQSDDRNRDRYDDFQRQSCASYGVFELEPGVVFRHLPRERVTALFARFEPIDLIELPIVTMNGNAAMGFQYLGRRRP